jgi:hypothetical protein
VSVSANQVSTLAQSLVPGSSYVALAVAPMTAPYPAGGSLQVGPDAGPNLVLTLSEACSIGDEFLSTTGITPTLEFVSGIGIFDPTSSTGAGATGNRPAGPTVGAQFYDTTLGKPIWWNGAVWKDASGATV